MKDPVMIMRARDLLERARAADPSYQPSLWLLAELLEQDQRHEEACTILMKHLDTYPSARTYQLVGDCLVRLHREDEAFTYYNYALRMDPTNQRAIEGLNNMGRPQSSKMDTNYYTPVGGENSSYVSQGTNISSDHDNDAESDSDAWVPPSDFMSFD